MNVERSFASYASASRESVLQARQLLRSAGMDLFIDCLNIRGGENWEHRLAEEIEKAQYFYLFWSEKAAKSQYVRWELNKALTENRDSPERMVIVPVVLDGTSLPSDVTKFQRVSLSTLTEGFAAGFVTESVTAGDGCFSIQFTISNPNKVESINLFDLRAAIIDAQCGIQFAPGSAHRLPKVTLTTLRRLKADKDVTLLQSESGVFLGTRLFENDFFRLAPGEMDTFKTDLVVDATDLVTWAVGFILRYSDATGKRRARTSDCTFILTNDMGDVSIVALGLDAIRERLDRINEYSFEGDVSARLRLSGSYMLTEASAPDPKWFLEDCKQFLELDNSDLTLMTPI